VNSLFVVIKTLIMTMTMMLTTTEINTITKPKDDNTDNDVDERIEANDNTLTTLVGDINVCQP